MAARTDAMPDGASEGIPPKGTCRCQATIAPSVLDGYACGNPDCWRTAVAQASFDRFVAELIQRHEREPRETDPPQNECGPAAGT